jgi:epoxyqueuosine reductase
MADITYHLGQQTTETERLKTFVRSLGIDLVGIANLESLEETPIGIEPGSTGFLENYRYAVVLGAQLNKLGKRASGSEVSLLMEKAALDVMGYLEARGYPALAIHTEDEFDPIRRMGLLSLKVLAKGAGLGWQGRSLLIISPEYGPVHRWIAVLTNMDLKGRTVSLTAAYRGGQPLSGHK